MLKMLRDEEIEQVKANLSSVPPLIDALGSDWINKALLTRTERKKVHVLFWLLLNPMKSQKLNYWLQILKSSLSSTNFQGLINDLKKKSANLEFYSLLSEIEVLSFYMAKRNNFHSVEYEPTHGDIKITVDGYEVFLEVARLFSSEDQERTDKLENEVWEKLDELENNKYVLSFSISRRFSEPDVDPLCMRACFIAKTARIQ